MNRSRPKRSSGIGGRTGENVLLNKNIRKLADGTDNFKDYFTDSSSNISASYSSFSQTLGISTRSSKVLENVQGVTNSSPIKSKSPRIVIGSRSKKNILPPKNIRKLSNGRDVFEDYFSDDASLESTCSSAIPAYSSLLYSSRQSSQNKNSSEKAPAVAYSSPITRLSRSKAICNDTNNPSGSKSEEIAHSSPITRLSSSKAICNDANNPSGSKSEEIGPLISNTSTKKNKKSKGSAKKLYKEHDSCDAKLLKLAEDYENSKNLSGNDSQSHAMKKAKSNIPESFKTSQSIASESSIKKTVSDVSLEKHILTRSRSHKTPTKPYLEKTDNLLIKNTDKNISLKKHYIEQNISKASYSNMFGSDFQRSKSQQSHFDENTAQNSGKSYEVNSVPEQDGALFGNKNSTRKLRVKRKSNLMPNTASKKKSNSFVASSMHGKNVQASKDLLDSDLNVTFEVDNPQCLSLSSEENSNNHDSQFHEKEKADSNPFETLEHFQKIVCKSPKKTFFVSPEEQHNLTTSYIETSIETQSGKMDDMLVKTSDKNIPENKQVFSPNISNSNKLRRNKPVHSHFDINTAQDSEESSEENGVAEQERTSYGSNDIARKSNLKHVTATKRKSNSFVASVKKQMSADKHKERMSLSLNSKKNLNKTNKNLQHVDNSLHNVLNATFQVNNPELSLSSNEETLRETNKSKASFQFSESHKNKENGGKNEQTSKRKKANKSHENPKPKTKDKGSSVAQENVASFARRRSGRRRLAPLEAWRNERACYRIENGSVHFINIDPGNKEDDGPKQAIAARIYNNKKRKEESKKMFKKPPKFKFKDIVLKEKVTLPLLKKFCLIPWEGELDDKTTHRTKRAVQTCNSNFGFIEIKAGRSKPLTYLPNEDIYLCLIHGKLKASIGEKEIVVDEKDILVVPRSVPYSLKNDGQRKALLVYSVGRYKYLENTLFG